MIRLLHTLLHPRGQDGRRRGVSYGGGPLRSTQFIGFMSAHGGLRNRTDRYESRLRRRKTFRSFASLGALAGVAWVLVESANAFSIF
jgi:hypothetical protein